MLFNTRGLAVSTVAAAVASAAYFFAAAAMDKLAFIDTMLSTKKVDAGVLLELICDLKQSKYLAGWFRKRGYGLRVASGEASEGRKGVRNSVAVFYRLRKFKEARGDVVGKYKPTLQRGQSGWRGHETWRASPTGLPSASGQISIELNRMARMPR
jgi:hypothetical protein